MSDLTTLPDDIRHKILAINTRANQDAAFRQRLHDDPLGELTAAGLPTAAAQAVIAFEPTEAEVTGYFYQGCADGTCWTTPSGPGYSICPGSCFVTVD